MALASAASVEGVMGTHSSAKATAVSLYRGSMTITFAPRSLARAIEAVARADHEVKGAGRDPQWSVQRMVMEICRARRARQGLIRFYTGIRRGSPAPLCPVRKRCHHPASGGTNKRYAFDQRSV